MNRHKVLIADDNEPLRRLVGVTLGTRDYDLLFAADGTEALDLAYRHRPALAILDINMPGLNGFEVCRALRSAPATASTVVMLMTARAQLTDRIEGQKAGATEYCTKPVSPLRLRDRVRALLEAAEETGNP